MSEADKASALRAKPIPASLTNINWRFQELLGADAAVYGLWSLKPYKITHGKNALPLPKFVPHKAHLVSENVVIRPRVLLTRTRLGETDYMQTLQRCVGLQIKKGNLHSVRIESTRSQRPPRSRGSKDLLSPGRYFWGDRG